jgi:type I restriction enzyme M protein
LELSRRLLTENGRAAVLVPQSVLFGRSNDSLGVRQRLLRHGRVDAVITVPAGAIEQYSAVKTAILLVSARGVTRRVWFLQLPELDDVPAGGLDPARFDQDVVDAVRSKAFNMPTPTGRAATLAEGMWQASIDEISDRNWTLLPSTYLVPELAAGEPEDPLELLAQIEEGQTEIGERLALARRLLEEA